MLAEIAWHHGGIDAVIGHSLGATAAALAPRVEQVRPSKIVLISPPSDLVGYSRRFARWHWMPEPLRRRDAGRDRGALRRALGRARARARRAAPAAPALVIHDRDDHMVPWTQGAKVAQHWPRRATS